MTAAVGRLAAVDPEASPASAGSILDDQRATQQLDLQFSFFGLLGFDNITAGLNTTIARRGFLVEQSTRNHEI